MSLKLITAAALVGTTSAIMLDPSNWDAETAGKTIFVKMLVRSFALKFCFFDRHIFFIVVNLTFKYFKYYIMFKVLYNGLDS